MVRLLPALFGLLLAGCGGDAGESVASSLVLVTVDTLRADQVAPYGGPVETPTLDRLAAEGVVIEWAFTSTPTTGPAHASLFTGWYPWRHGVLDNAIVLGPQPVTLAERLHREGFETAAFVSSYVLHPRFGLARGFDHYELVATEGLVWREEEHTEFYTRAEVTTDRARAWLQDALARRGRFFLWVHYFDPHLPYEPPVRFALPPSHPVDLTGKRAPDLPTGRAALPPLIRAYRGEVRYVDAEIGRLLAPLAELDPERRTALVVTADHGEGLGDHGVIDHGLNLFDELVRVPLIVRAPGLAGGRRVDGLAQLEDLYPTLLALVGVDAGEGLDGVDLLGLWRGSGGASRERVLGRRRDYDELPRIFFARGTEEKWIGLLEGPGHRFRLAADPREQHGEPAGAAPEELQRSVRGAGSGTRAPLGDAEARRALEALGYLDARARP